MAENKKIKDKKIEVPKNEEDYGLYLELQEKYKNKNKFSWRTWLLKVKTNILLMLPLGFYIWVLQNKTTSRMTDYTSVLGTDPISYKVYHGVILIDLNKMVI